MKALINNTIVEVKMVENLGYQSSAGMYCKLIEYNGKEYHVVCSRRNGLYKEWKIKDRLDIQDCQRKKGG